MQRPNFASTLRDVPSTGYFHDSTLCFLRHCSSYFIYSFIYYFFRKVGRFSHNTERMYQPD